MLHCWWETGVAVPPQTAQEMCEMLREEARASIPTELRLIVAVRLAWHGCWGVFLRAGDNGSGWHRTSLPTVKNGIWGRCDRDQGLALGRPPEPLGPHPALGLWDCFEKSPGPKIIIEVITIIIIVITGIDPQFLLCRPRKPETLL